MSIHRQTEKEYFFDQSNIALQSELKIILDKKF